MREYLRCTLSDLRHRISFLLAKTKGDQEDQMEVKESLRKHIDSVSKEMDERKCKVRNSKERDTECINLIML